MGTLAYVCQQINAFTYQESPRDFHIFLNVPQETLIALSCVKQLFFPNHTQHHPKLSKSHLRSIPFTAALARFVCAVSKRGSVSCVCLEVAVWTCRAPAEPCMEPPVLALHPCSACAE